MKLILKLTSTSTLELEIPEREALELYRTARNSRSVSGADLGYGIDQVINKIVERNLNRKKTARRA